MCSISSSMDLPPLRFGSLICSQISASDFPTQAISIGARCHCGWPGMPAGIEVRRSVTGRAAHADGAEDCPRRERPAAVRMAVVALRGPVAGRMAVHAARMRMTFPASTNSATERSFWSAMLANDGSRLQCLAGWRFASREGQIPRRSPSARPQGERILLSCSFLLRPLLQRGKQEGHTRAGR